MAGVFSWNKMYRTSAIAKVHVAVHLLKKSECTSYTSPTEYTLCFLYLENYFYFLTFTLKWSIHCVKIVCIYPLFVCLKLMYYFMKEKDINLIYFSCFSSIWTFVCVYVEEYILFRDVEHCGIRSAPENSPIQFGELDHHSI
jgi:hypothetical protein